MGFSRQTVMKNCSVLKGRIVQPPLHNRLDGNSSCSYTVCCVAVRAASGPECVAFLMRVLRSL